jgi:GTPase SAR1 family protein
MLKNFSRPQHRLSDAVVLDDRSATSVSSSDDDANAKAPSSTAAVLPPGLPLHPNTAGRRNTSPLGPPSIPSPTVATPTALGERRASFTSMARTTGGIGSSSAAVVPALGPLALVPLQRQPSPQQTQVITPTTPPAPSPRQPVALVMPPAQAPASPPGPLTPTEMPRTVLVLGGAGTGKSSLINAFRQLTSPSQRWERAPVGRIGRNSTATVAAYYNTSHGDRRPATWCFVDYPGRIFGDLNDDTTRDGRLLRVMLRGLPQGAHVAGRAAFTLEQLEALADGVPGVPRPEHILVTVSARDLVGESRAWLGLRQAVTDSPSATSTTNYLATLLDFLHHYTDGCVPHVVVTHMDTYRDWERAETRIRELLHDICPVTNQHYVGLPPRLRNTSPEQLVKQDAVPLVAVARAASARRQPDAPPRGVAEFRAHARPDAPPDNVARGLSRTPEVLEPTPMMAGNYAGSINLNHRSREAVLALHQAMSSEVAARRRRSCAQAPALRKLLQAPQTAPASLLDLAD